MTEIFNIKQLENMKMDELKALANDLGVSDEGKKAEIIERIMRIKVQSDCDTDVSDNEKIQTTDATENEKEKAADVPETDTVRVKVIKTYKDLQAMQVFRPGFEFNTSKKRAAELVNAKVAIIVG